MVNDPSFSQALVQPTVTVLPGRCAARASVGTPAPSKGPVASTLSATLPVTRSSAAVRQTSQEIQRWNVSGSPPHATARPTALGQCSVRTASACPPVPAMRTVLSTSAASRDCACVSIHNSLPPHSVVQSMHARLLPPNIPSPLSLPSWYVIIFRDGYMHVADFHTYILSFFSDLPCG